MMQIEEVCGRGSYLSSNDQHLHFGLSADAVMKNVEIQWPSRLKEELQNVLGDTIYTVIEGKGIRGANKLPSPGTPPGAK
jgi:hypothetical protein